MLRSRHVNVHIDLARVRSNAESIARTSGVPVFAVVKADAYGLGARRVAEAIRDVVHGFYTFYLSEALDAALPELGKSTLCLLGHDQIAAADLAELHIRPIVWTPSDAERLRGARPVLSVDTGMQRFACPPEQVSGVLATGACEEAMTHATTLPQVQQLVELAGGRGLRLHAAATALLGEPRAWLDAVRPGLALFHDAVRVSARLVETRVSRSPVGYTGFSASHHGVILSGYSNGLRVGPCLVNGRLTQVREVGMQSAYIDLGPEDRPGDEVILLGSELRVEDVAAAWHTSRQEVLLRMCGMGERAYTN